jgi:hypothetical protein
MELSWMLNFLHTYKEVIVNALDLLSFILVPVTRDQPAVATSAQPLLATSLQCFAHNSLSEGAGEDCTSFSPFSSTLKVPRSRIAESGTCKIFNPATECPKAFAWEIVLSSSWDLLQPRSLRIVVTPWT